MSKTTSLKNYMIANIDGLRLSLDKLHNISSSKVLNKDEMREAAIQVTSFNHTMKKCCNGHLIPNGMKPLAINFEKSGFNVAKMDPLYINGLKKTYEDLSMAMKSDTSLNKDSSAKLYCDIYETMNGSKFKEMAAKIKSSSVVKGSSMSSEGLTFMESLDTQFYEGSRGMESYSQSQENIFLSIRAMAAGFTGTATNLSGLTNSVNILTLIISIVVIILFIMLATMVTIFTIYNSRLNRAIVLITEDVTGKEILEVKERERIIRAAKEIDENTPILTKASLYKSSRVGCDYVNRLTTKDYTTFSKGIDQLNKMKSKEGFDPEESTESFLAAAISVAVLFMIIPLTRLGVYWMHHCNLNYTQFFEEQKEILDVNIDQLLDKANDDTTPESEKKRLNKIIKRQEGWSKRLAKWSGTIEESHYEANSNVDAEIAEDEKHDFDHDVYLIEKETAKTESSVPVTEMAPGSIII